MARYGSILGFSISATAAITQAWSLPLFCWSTWLAAYGFSLLAVGSAAVRICLTPPLWPVLDSLRRWQQRLITTGIALLAAVVMAWLYSYLFGFYGLFLSVFATMEPTTLFGPNGFINSDFWTPVAYLCDRLWPMLLGVGIANSGDLLRGNPWRGLVAPFQSQHILRVHLLVVIMPFVAMLAWLLFPGRYQPIAIVLLLALFYFLPEHQPHSPEGTAATPTDTSELQSHRLAKQSHHKTSA